MRNKLPIHNVHEIITLYRMIYVKNNKLWMWNGQKLIKVKILFVNLLSMYS